MGLFGKLFDKKECAICGGEIGLLGNRKLEDGNMCKHCAAKLSPWFSDRKHSTVSEIEAQLEARKAAIHAAVLEAKLAEVEDNAPRYQAIKEGRIQPTRCERCDYCKATKKLTAILDYREIF